MFTVLTADAGYKEKAEKRVPVVWDEGLPERCYLSRYLYSGEAMKPEEGGGEPLHEAECPGPDLSRWEKWHSAILVEADGPFFNTAPGILWDELDEGLPDRYFSMELNSHQSLLLFEEEDCTGIAQQIYVCLKQKYETRFYLAASSAFDGYRSLPRILKELEFQTEEKYFHPDARVFFSIAEKERFTNEETRDSQLMQLISEDIIRKDGALLERHFSCLAGKYRKKPRFSAMYVKFVFSGVLQELFMEKSFAGEQKLDEEIRRMYACTDMDGILKIAWRNIRAYRLYLERTFREAHPMVERVLNRIRDGCGKDLSVERLAREAGTAPGYLNLLCRKETGMSFSRYLHMVRMEKAWELIRTTKEDIGSISRQTGFKDAACFGRFFLDYFGFPPER